MRVWLSVQIHWGFGEYYFGWYLHILKNVSPGEIHQILAVNISSLRIGFPFEKILKKRITTYLFFKPKKGEKN